MPDRPLTPQRHRRGTPLAALALAILALAGCAAVGGCGSGGARRTGALRFGFNDSAGPRSYPLQARLGAPIRRMLVGWNQVEPRPGQWDWSGIDAAYGALLHAGLRPLLVAIAAPCWAHPSVPCERSRTATVPPDPAFEGAWADYVRRLAGRYPAAVGVEVWNEENLAAEFPPRPDPARYAQLLEAAYRAVKSVAPRIPVVSGGLFGSPASGGGALGDAPFLSAIFSAGAKAFLDGIGIHPYPVPAGSSAPARYDPAVMEQTLGRIRAVRALAGDRAPLWVTETGVSTQAYPGSPAPATPAQQAADLLEMVRDAERDGDVQVMIIHQLLDPPPGVAARLPGHEPGYGVLGADGRPKPAACVLSAAWHGALRC